MSLYEFRWVYMSLYEFKYFSFYRSKHSQKAFFGHNMVTKNHVSRAPLWPLHYATALCAILRIPLNTPSIPTWSFVFDDGDRDHHDPTFSGKCKCTCTTIDTESYIYTIHIKKHYEQKYHMPHMLYTICSVVYLHIPWTSMDQKRRFSSRHGPASRKAKRWHSSPPTYWVIDGLMISNHKKSIQICVNYIYVYTHSTPKSIHVYLHDVIYIYIHIVSHCVRWNHCLRTHCIAGLLDAPLSCYLK